MSRSAQGGSEVPVRRASTVMLVRDGETGIEVFTLQRASSMAFAAGMTAFPGGGVDETDADPAVPWVGPEPDWWADQWGIAVADARSQVVAAVRELFEETGVLLAGDAPLLAGFDRLGEAERRAVTVHERSMAAVLRNGNLPLRADLLRPWARWITPLGPPRRYDTYFFLAALPDGQRARLVTTEAAAGGWRRPADVLAAAEAGSVGLMPPTIAMLTDLAEATSSAALLETPRVVAPVTPTVLTAEGEVLRVRAGGREYTATVSRPPG